jgi:hypothetical protein
VAIVTIPGKLRVAVWHALTERAADRYTRSEMVAFSGALRPRGGR